MSVKGARWVNGLDSLRFILALIVLLSHLPDPYVILLKNSPIAPIHLLGVIASHLFSGAAAVTGFFIISGFVIHYPNRHVEQVATFPFLIRRLVRIGIPMLAISMVAAHYHSFFALPLWSLYCELAYYILYPVLLKIKGGWKTKLYTTYTLSAVLIIVLIAEERGLLHLELFKGRTVYWQLFIIFINLPCWLLGVTLAERADGFKENVSATYLWSMRLGSFLLGMISVGLRMQLHINYTYSLVIFALFFYKWLEAEIIYHRQKPARAFSEYLGRFSYSLYLCHLLFIPLIAHYMPMGLSTFWLFILLPILMSYVVYLVLEYPSHRLAQWLAKRLN